MVITRFAPSPTNNNEDKQNRGLHIGGLRTALFNWAYARRNGGRFILRIEDTDEERSNTDSVFCMMRDLTLTGLNWDEGPSSSHYDLEKKENQVGENGPYYQSQRKDIYNKYIDELLKKGLAYEKDGAVFFSMPKEEITLVDEILGEIKMPAVDCQDFVIRKSSGIPSFYFAVTIDDHCMNITHVIRGQEHINTAFRQIALEKALGVNIPKFAHIPLIMNQDGSKMSKRQTTGQVNFWDFYKDGYCIATLLNYISNLGWANRHVGEVYDLNTFVEYFDVKDICKANARFDYKKLLSMNKYYISQLGYEYFEREIAKYGNYFYPQVMKDIANVRNVNLMGMLSDIMRGRIKTLKDFFEDSKFIISEDYQKDTAASDKIMKDTISLKVLEDMAANLRSIINWNAGSIMDRIDTYAKAVGLSRNKIIQPIRIAISGKDVSPPIDMSLAALGREVALARINSFAYNFRPKIVV